MYVHAKQWRRRLLPARGEQWYTRRTTTSGAYTFAAAAATESHCYLPASSSTRALPHSPALLKCSIHSGTARPVSSHHVACGLFRSIQLGLSVTTHSGKALKDPLTGLLPGLRKRGLLPPLPPSPARSLARREKARSGGGCRQKRPSRPEGAAAAAAAAAAAQTNGESGHPTTYVQGSVHGIALSVVSDDFQRPRTFLLRMPLKTSEGKT